ncbi:hypothetical protein GCM10023196_053420 [Actinoallomurus vinaceus]|uniref:FAD/NAD(P)-binding domain-containing protein n=1 Tax=Actinoallomurus vinaceus TaxID=1080074 RepID=A0ABP8UHI0_9ACTN
MKRPRIVILGAGFAGFQAARTLSRTYGDAVEVVLVNPTDFAVYLPLLPEVAAGIVDPRHISVSITATLPGVRLVLGTVTGLDPKTATVEYIDPEARPGTLGYDRLIVAVGSVTKVLPIEGATRHSHGFKGIPEALYLRDHMIRQVELAAVADDPAERAARLTFVVVGAGYSGTEVAAAGQLLTRALIRRNPLLRGERARWLLLQLGDHVLPEMRPRMRATAERVLTRRGVEVRLGTSINRAASEGVTLTDGEFVGARTVVWTTGVRPDPVVDGFGLPTAAGGRVAVDEYMAVRDHPGIYAAGDVAAVPDLTRPGQITPMTGQHATRQGKVVARNVAASLGLHGRARPYRHRNLGFVVDLGGWKAAADPLGVPLSGVLAKAVTRGYHLWSIPANRPRILTDWVLDAVLPRLSVQLGLVRSGAVPLDTADPELPYDHSPASVTTL